MSTLICIGMDVHKQTTSITSFNREDNKVFAEIEIPTQLSEIIRYLDNRQEEFEGKDVSFKLGYEAGCLGTWLAEDLNTAGYDCVVMAPATIAKSSLQNKKKNDANDAIMIAKALAWNQFSEVHLLDKEDKSVREFIRFRADRVDDLKRSKQRLLAFLLRHNLRYESGKRPWTLAYMKWLHSLKLEDVDKDTLGEMIKVVEDLMDEIKRLDAKVDELSSKPTYKDNIAMVFS